MEEFKMKRIFTALVILAMLLTMTVIAHADDAVAAPDTVESQVSVDSEEVSSEDVTEKTSSADVSEEASETVSLGIPSETEPELDFVITMAVFVLAAGAIVAIIVFTTKKK